MRLIGFICRCFWEILKSVIFPVLIVLAFILLIEITIQYFKYGKNIFNCFKKKDVTDSRDKILYITLDKIEGYKKIIKLPYLNSNYVVVDKNGISIFYSFLKSGNMMGNENDEQLLLKDQSNEEYIDNPLLVLNNDELKIREIFPDVEIKKYLLVLDNGYLTVKTNVNVIKYSKLLYLLPKEPRYNQTEIDQFTEKLLNNVSNNVQTIDKN